MIKQRATLSICHLCSGFLHFFDVSTHVESTYSIDNDDYNNNDVGVIMMVMKEMMPILMMIAIMI